ncbi:YhcN/YlaJ family sporulation lipoprotein [Aeribacillus sp. FSL K6-8210]|uniref:YhcN/YlaJ family sporulation lipoprotein n=1 Tax=Aeribacillus sp. FSL K6-8210 TaxID=2954683 RepID=UPI0030CB7F47
MKKRLFTPFIIAALAASGCQYDQEGKGLYNENGNTVNVAARNDNYNSNKDSDSFGYVRHQKSPTAGIEKATVKTPVINREQLADVIGRLAVQLPNVHDAATLVTDEEVLIAYKTDSNNKFETADQVKKTAASIVPRYFHIYVTDNPNLFKEIESYSTLDGESPNINRNLNQTIQRMLKSPQGRKLNAGENANGEGFGEMNESIDHDIKDQ